MWTGLLAGAGGGWLTEELTKASGGQLNLDGDGEVWTGIGVRIGEGVGVEKGVGIGVD